MFVDLENCSLIQKYFMSRIRLVFGKSLYILVLRVVRGMRFIFKVLNVPLCNIMTSVACTGKLIALGFTASNAL